MNVAAFEREIAAVRDGMQAMHEARETILVSTRKMGQLAAKSIRHVHRRDFAGAEALLRDAQAAAKTAREMLAPHPELNPAYLHDTEKEMVEAAVVLALVQNADLPTREALGCGTNAYLHGLAEAASEVRRFALDEMREGRLGEAGRILSEMEAIYEELIAFDFPDSLTNGLRRALDALRAVIERTRSDLTATVSQQRLVEALERAAKPTSVVE